MAKVLVFGNGIIGKATVSLLKRLGNEVEVYDEDSSKSFVTKEELGGLLGEVSYVFLVVPTEPCKLGMGLENLEKCLSLVKERCSTEVTVVQRSSTLPGQARQLSVFSERKYVVFPSFAYRKTAAEDEINAEKIVLGGDSLDVLVKVCGDLRLFDLGSDVFFGTYEDVEAAKLYSNLFQCLILGAWNELKYLDERVDTNFVMATVIKEKNLCSIKRFHGKAWGSDGRMEKDLLALVTSRESEIFEAVYRSNLKVRKNYGEEVKSSKELAKDYVSGNVSRGLS